MAHTRTRPTRIKRRALVHGTINGYVNQKCRCRKCKAVWARYMQQSRRRWARAGRCVECKRHVWQGKTRCKMHHQKHSQ